MHQVRPHTNLHVVAGAAAGDDVVPARGAAVAFGSHVIERHL